MPKLPGVNHLAAVRALEKIGFVVIRQGKHITMSDGLRTIQIPRANPVNAYTFASAMNGTTSRLIALITRKLCQSATGVQTSPVRSRAECALWRM